MDANFSVPKVPIVRAVGTVRPVSDEHGTHKTSQVSQSRRKISVTSSSGKVSHSRLTKPETGRKETSTENVATRQQSQPSPSQPPSVQTLFPLSSTLPKLCPSCSVILINYLKPIEDYVKNILTLTTALVANQALESENRQVASKATAQASSPSGQHPQQQDINPESTTNISTESIRSQQTRQIEQEQQKHPKFEHMPDWREESREEKSHEINNSTVECSPLTPTFSTFTNSPQHRRRRTSEEYSTVVQHNEPSVEAVATTAAAVTEEAPKVTAPLPTVVTTVEDDGKFIQSSAPNDADGGDEIPKVCNTPSNESFQLQNTGIVGFGDSNRDVAVHHHEPQPADGGPASGDRESVPYAFTTIVHDNLSALNAILLLNSLQFYDNQQLVITAAQNEPAAESRSLLDSSKQIVARYHIPTIVCVDNRAHISPNLLEILSRISDQIIELSTVTTSLLDNESFGIVHRKMHLWNELKQFEKCIFLESSTLVVANITNLFHEAYELSACVDCFNPDCFNCSMFVFEPSAETYGEMLRFGLEQKLNVDSDYETLDESALLNTFFAHKWNRISFVYNFVRTEHSYTQIPAYLKFGAGVRIVNFQFFSQHPWNFKFNLVKAQMEENPLESLAMDNYIKFYLRLFMCRVWPLLEKVLTEKILQSKNKKLDWTVVELLELFAPGASSVWQSNPIIFRRKTSTAGPSHFTSALSPQSAAPSLSASTPELVAHESVDSIAEKSSEIQSDLLPGRSHSPDHQAKTSNLKHAHEAVEEDESRIPDSTLENLFSETQSSESTRRTSVHAISDSSVSLEQPKPMNIAQQQLPNSDNKMDWMGEMQSDQIIDRLKTLFRN